MTAPTIPWSTPMTTAPLTPPTERHDRVQRLYARLLAETPEIRDPNSTYWRMHFQAAARKLAELMGLDRYRLWFDRHFPLDKHIPDWKAQYTAANAALYRIQERRPDHYEEQIACEMNVSLEGE